MANSHFGAPSSQAATLDTTSQTLVAPLTLLTPSGTMSFNTDTPVATFGKPDPFNVDLNAGALTSSMPIDVPSGPGGLTPPVDLTYSSAGVAEQHNPQGAAGWAGEGWNLDLGSISWAEHNSNASCTSGCGNGWEDTWQLSDPFGTSVELIPPNINVATYFDDTTTRDYRESRTLARDAGQLRQNLFLYELTDAARRRGRYIRPVSGSSSPMASWRSSAARRTHWSTTTRRVWATISRTGISI